MVKIRRDLCSNCEKETDFAPILKEETISVRKEPLKVKVQYYKCGKCGDEVLDPTSDIDPFNIAYDEYRKRHGLLKPSEITVWRKVYHLTQGELAKLIGIGTATLSRYENGSLQEESHDKLLRFAMQPANLLKLVEDSEGIFKSDKKQRLVLALKEAGTDFCSIDNAIALNLGDYEPNEFSGYKKLDIAKLYNLILFFCKDGVWKTKLMKLLFYADFKHYKEYAVPITGAQYAHVPFGPAPDSYQMYLASLSLQDATESIEKVFSDEASGEIIKGKKEPELAIFSPSELRIMASVAEDFANYGSKQISEFSHKEAGYQETSNGELISYAYAARLNY